MYHGWGRLGGNEIFNTERTKGLAETFDCPNSWLKCEPCESLPDALATLDGEASQRYEYENISEAPWYDGSMPGVSSRFFGLYPVSVRWLSDSTRAGSMTEKVGDGGVLQNVRKSSREVRVRGMMLARGADALDYGMGWLAAALDQGACGQHGTACGLTDFEYLTDCPPARGTHLEWQETGSVTNLNGTPSFEEFVENGYVTRRNYLTQPQLSQGTDEWISNMGTISSVTWGAKIDITDDADTILFRPAVGHGTSEGEVWSARYEVYNPIGAASDVSFKISMSWTGAGSIVDGDSVTLPPGGIEALEITNVVAPVGATAAVPTLYRTSDIPVGAEVWVRDDPMLTRDGDPLFPTFSGDEPDRGDLNYAWGGTPNSSASLERAPLPVGYAGGLGAQIYSSSEWSYEGARSAEVVNEGTEEDPYVLVRLSDPGSGAFTPGETYTVALAVRVETDRTTASDVDLIFDTSFASTATLIPKGTFLASGEHTFRTTFVMPSGTDSPSGYIRLSPSSFGFIDASSIFYDMLTVVEGDYSGPLFSGDTGGSRPAPSSEGQVVHAYTWDGEPHQSTSTRTQYMAVVVDDSDTEYRAEIIDHARYMHRVAAISGPIIEEEYDRGGWNAYIVEFTLASESPYTYSRFEEIDSETTQPALIQDTLSNYIRYPSAELATSGSLPPLGWRSFAEGSATSGGSGVVRRWSGGLVGQYSTRVLFTAATGAGFEAGTDITGVGVAPATPTVEFNGQISVMMSEGVAETSGWLGQIIWLDSSGNVLGKVTGSGYPGGGVANRWQRTHVRGVAPVGTAGAAIGIVTQGPIAANEWIRLDAATIYVNPGAFIEYFDGDTPDTDQHVYSWTGTPHESFSLREVNEASVTDPLADPDCPPVPAPPRPPQVDVACVTPTGVWNRHWLTIPASEIPEWAAAIPEITLSTGSFSERQVRIRFWPNPEGVAPEDFVAGEYEFELIVSFVPTFSTMTIDAVSMRATVLTSDGETRDASHLLYGSRGLPPEWPALRCGVGYLVSFDTPTESNPTNLEIGAGLTLRWG